MKLRTFNLTVHAITIGLSVLQVNILVDVVSYIVQANP